VSGDQLLARRLLARAAQAVDQHLAAMKPSIDEYERPRSVDDLV
jgi:hypothetical protein